ncbi:MAG: FMN-binding protein, partial [Gammaproteobacteria bacterium]|nr:FMN-binding protein [Gammaproteobacteria bacterium]
IGALCALLLAGTHRLTADDIRANRDAHAWRVAFDLVGAEFPTAGLHWDGDRLDLPDGVRLLRSSINGYAGEIEFIAAFRPGRNGANSLAGVRVTGHRETPGLGDFIDTARSPWIHRFSGRQPEEVDAVTGATITSEAVKRGVSALLRSMAEPVHSGNSGDSGDSGGEAMPPSEPQQPVTQALPTASVPETAARAKSAAAAPETALRTVWAAPGTASQAARAREKVETEWSRPGTNRTASEERP